MPTLRDKRVAMVAEFSSDGLVAVIGVIAVAGIVLLKMGMWPRRRGWERRCRACGYVVEKISSERCPECGAILAGRGKVIGERRRRPLVWGSGVALLLLAAGWSGREIYRVGDWYRWKPARWVMGDLQGRGLDPARLAWAELLRRRAKGSLSQYWEEKMVEAVLAGTAPPPNREDTADGLKFLWEEYEAGKMRADQVDRFIREATQTWYKVRPVVLVGQNVPYFIYGERYVPKGWILKFVDDGGWRVWDRPSKQAGAGVLAGSAKQTPGEHEVEFKYYAALYRAESGMDSYKVVKTAKPVWEAWQAQRVKVTVVKKGGEGYMTMVEAPELSEQIKASLTIDSLVYQAAKKSLSVSMHAENAPLNLAFDVVARIDGVEHPLGDVIFGQQLPWGRDSATGSIGNLAAPEKIDLIFRSSEAAAGRTVYLFKIWKGDIVFKDVMVANPK